MEMMFKNWLIKRGNKGAANTYPSLIHKISEHYSAQIGEKINIYKLKDHLKVSEIAHDYSTKGKFSEFGYTYHGGPRNAIARYSEFFVASRGEEGEFQEEFIAEPETEEADFQTFAYEKDLQTALCSQISELFPGYQIFGGLGIGVEYSIGGKRIDVLLENEENKDLLVVELKSGEADFRVFGQISMYIGLLNQQFPEKNIKGVIVAGAINESLVQACKITDKVSLQTYRMNIELEDFS